MNGSAILNYVPTIIFVGFLFAGVFKTYDPAEAPRYDLTVVTAVITCASLALIALKRFPRAYTLMLMWGFFLSFVPALQWTVWHPYAFEKTQRFFTLTFLAATYPLFAFQSAKESEAFVNTVLGFSFLIVILGAYSLVTSEVTLDRLNSLGASTIMLSRVAGLAMIWIFIMGQKSWIWTIVSMILVIPLGAVALAAGSRGPLVSLAVTFAVITVVSWHGKGRALRNMALMIFVAVAVLSFLVTALPEASLERLNTFAQGDFGDSERVRVLMIDASLSNIPENPLGIGLGGFMVIFLEGDESRSFPHNLILEATLEGGWLSGILFIGTFGLVVAGYLALMRRKKAERLDHVLFSFIIFMFLNDLVSGELNDSKLYFALVASGLARVAHARVVKVETPSDAVNPTLQASPA